MTNKTTLIHALIHRMICGYLRDELSEDQITLYVTMNKEVPDLLQGVRHIIIQELLEEQEVACGESKLLQKFQEQFPEDVAAVKKNMEEFNEFFVSDPQPGHREEIFYHLLSITREPKKKANKE